MGACLGKPVEVIAIHEFREVLMPIIVKELKERIIPQIITELQMTEDNLNLKSDDNNK